MELIVSYINLLIDSLNQKKSVLTDIFEITNQQADIANEEHFSLDVFEETLNKKEQLITQITMLDDGFNSLYERVRHDLLKEKDNYKGKIQQLKTLISEVAELGIAIQVQEEKNKLIIEKQLSKHKKEIRKFKNSRKSVNNYHKNMKNTHNGQSYFVDKKN
jgi:hypothetical protein